MSAATSSVVGGEEEQQMSRFDVDDVDDADVRLFIVVFVTHLHCVVSLSV